MPQAAARYDAAMRFLVTAGNTRERIDQVRDWGNIFTGNTGLAIARALAEVGEVDLLTSNQQHLAELERHAQTRHRVHGTPFTSHADLRATLANLVATRSYAGIFMAAAVADYTPAGSFQVIERRPLDNGCEQWIVRDVQAGKIGSGYEQVAFLGRQTEKLVDLFRREWGYRGLLVKFKLEVGRTREQLLDIGRKSRLSSQADYLVANTLDMVTGERAGAYLIGPESDEWVPRGELPARLRRLAEEHARAE